MTPASAPEPAPARPATGPAAPRAEIVVIGGGLAGLSCAWEVAKAAKRVLVLEKDAAVGGLASTFSKGGFRFDTGPHRWYTKSDEVNRWMVELLEDDLLRVPRLTRIYFDKKFFFYPMRFVNLWRLGLLRAVRAFVDFALNSLRQALAKPRPCATIEDAYVRQFGRQLYEIFFKRYTEKLWGRPCRELSADWVVQRSRNLSLFTVAKDLFAKSRGRVVSLVDEFMYPRQGIGRLADKLAENVRAAGGEILLGSRVVEVRREGLRVRSVVVSDGNGSTAELAAGQFVSSMPITDLVRALTPAAPEEVLAASREVRYRDQVQVALFVDKVKIFPDNWIYVHPSELCFMRLMEMDNWSPDLAQPGKTTLVFELACDAGDATWARSDADLIELVTSQFIREFQAIRREDVLGGFVHRMEKNYPMYLLGYEKHVGVLKAYLRSFENLQLIGRNGTFRYNNMDHSVAMGLCAAKNLLGGNYDIESVNTEKEYLEVKLLRQRGSYL